MADGIVFVIPDHKVSTPGLFVVQVGEHPGFADVSGTLFFPIPTTTIRLDQPPQLNGVLNFPIPTLEGSLNIWDQFVSIQVGPSAILARPSAFSAMSGEGTIPIILGTAYFPLPTTNIRADVLVEVYAGALSLPSAFMVAEASAPVGLAGTVSIPLPTIHVEAVKPPLDVNVLGMFPLPSFSGLINAPLAVLSNNSLLPLPTVQASAVLAQSVSGVLNAPSPFILSQTTFRWQATANLTLPIPTTNGYVWAITEQDVAVVMNMPSPTIDGAMTLAQSVSASLNIPLPFVAGQLSGGEPQEEISGTLLLPLPSVQALANLRQAVSLVAELPLPTVVAQATFNFNLTGTLNLPMPNIQSLVELGGYRVSATLSVPSPFMSGQLLNAYEPETFEEAEPHLYIGMGIRLV